MRRQGTFHLQSPFSPQGDQPQAIQALVEGARAGAEHQVLLGVTGSGKTFTMAHVVERLFRRMCRLRESRLSSGRCAG